jgi:DNA-binding FadR family transcriptional regulator
MRSSPVLEALFPKVRQGVLAATLTQPGKWWYLSELAQFLHTTPSSLQRELKALAASGILEQRREGTRTYFKAETRSPLFPELRGLFEKTAGLLPTLQQALHPFRDRIACAFVYGSVARRQETALSDVDLMVIGAVGLAELAPALRKAEARLWAGGERHELLAGRAPRQSRGQGSFPFRRAARAQTIRKRGTA